MLLKNKNRYNPNKPALKKLEIKIPKSANGLAPDFAKTPYLYPTTGQQKNIVRIKLTGARTQGTLNDVAEANKLAGFGKKPPKGYTWHHLDDFNPVTGESSMQLVKTSVHRKTGPHLGSVKQYEDCFGIKYKP